MDIIEAFEVARRRWLITVIGLLVTCLVAIGLYFFVPTRYQASGQVVLLLSNNFDPAAETLYNPYLGLDDGVTFLGSLVVSSISTEQVHQEIFNAGFPSEYAIAMIPTAGPVINITVEDTDPASALATRSEVISRIAGELNRLQRGENIPTKFIVRFRENAMSTTAEPLSGSRLRAVVVAGGVGVLLTLIVAFARDRRVARTARAESKPG